MSLWAASVQGVGSPRGSGGEECGNSSGVKLLRWKIALTVMMLLFRVARVTLSFTSATPAGAAGCLSHAELLTAGCQGRAFRLSGEAGYWTAPGVAILGELRLAGPCALLPRLLVPAAGV